MCVSCGWLIGHLVATRLVLAVISVAVAVVVVVVCVAVAAVVAND